MDGNSFLKQFQDSYKHKQQIQFTGHDDDDNTVAVYGKDVIVFPSSGSHTSGSRNLRAQNIVDFGWEEKYYIGRLVATHILGNYVAYPIKPSGKPNGMVRVVERSSERKTLLKGMKGVVKDLGFAHTRGQVILAVVDEYGNLFIHEITNQATEDNQLCQNVLLHVDRGNSENNCNYHRVLWCPYIPDDSSVADSENGESINDDISKLLAITLDKTTEIWNIDMVNKEYGFGTVQPENVVNGYLRFETHEAAVIDGAFSPDGTALATASHDGLVKFFQVFLSNEEEPRFLHHWNPHDGKPLSCLFFFDNHLKETSNEMQFWRFAMTGADYNCELKLWCCATWKELQCIRFRPQACSINSPMPRLKAELDLSAKYLLLSDVTRKVVYVLTFQDEDDGSISVSSISEFLLSQPMLSMAIIDAQVRKSKKSLCTHADDEEVEAEDDDLGISRVKLRLYYIQPKSLQMCTMTFKQVPSDDNKLKQFLLNGGLPSANLPALSNGSVSSLAFEDNLLELSSQTSSEMNVTGDILAALNSNFNPNQILMSPEAFSSSTARQESTKKEEQKSSHSSPSREVQEILSNNPEMSSEVEAKCDDKTAGEDETLSDKKSLNISGGSGFPSPPQPPSSTTLVPPSEFLNSTEGTSPKASSSVNIHLVARQQKEAAAFKGWPEDDENRDEKQSGEAVTMNSILEILKTQQQQLQDLHLELGRIKMQGDNKPEVAIQNLSSQLGQMLTEQDQRDNVLLDAALERHGAVWANGAVMDRFMSRIAPIIEAAVRSEAKQCLGPAVSDMTDAMSSSLGQVSLQLNTVDQILSDSINKTLNNRNIIESLSSCCAHAIAPVINSCFKDAMTNHFLPGLEKITRTMMDGLQDTFETGTSEYLTQIESHFDRQKKPKDQLSGQVAACKQQIEKLSQELDTKLKLNFNTFSSELSKVVAMEVNKTQQHLEGRIVSAVRSGAATPLPQPDNTQLEALLARNQYNLAFQQALSAGDLRSVEFCIDRVNPSVLFEGGVQCPLQQAILLSLIQQLSADLTSHTDIKLGYLLGCITHLDQKDPVVSEHSHKIISLMKQQLENFLSRNPGSKHFSNIKLLIMAAGHH